jgi:hypothetical protein
MKAMTRYGEGQADFMGTEVVEPQPRMYAFYPYFRLSSCVDSNHYSFPIPLVFEWNWTADQLKGVRYLPIFGTGSKTLQDLSEPFPWHKMQPNEYAHGLREALGGTTRQDLKQLLVQQPQGVSFRVNNREIKWQKVRR